MQRFVGYATNGEYAVGCTGQTVYLLDKDGREIKRFKDITYAYAPFISPDGTVFVVKSTNGRLALYSLETFSLIKKFRFSSVNSAQDDGACFSPDGKLFINIERQQDELRSAISIYRTADLSLNERILLSEDMMLDHIEYDDMTSAYYVLGFVRGTDRVFRHGFVAKFDRPHIQSITAVSENEFDFYRSYKSLERFGFTEKQYAWTPIDCELERLRSFRHTLAKLYAYKNAE